MSNKNTSPNSEQAQKHHIRILNRWTKAVIFEGEYQSIYWALRAAIESRADLRGADLSDADLSDADLRGAVLSRAVLSRAVLSRAVLSGAVLSRAVLSGAVLSGADLSDADLRGADLSDADLSDADLSDADLSGAVLSRAVLSGAVLSRAVLSGAVLSGADGRPIPIPVVPNLDSKILSAITNGKGSLEMGSWHQCETTHCRAGWAIHLAGEAGRMMEAFIGPCASGALIYHASTGHVPNFFASTDAALADIKACAARESAEAEVK